jgi:SAV_6107-like HEPN
MSPIVQVRPGARRQPGAEPGAARQPGTPRRQARIAPSALALMESARHGLAAAEDEVSPGSRYVSAHLAALRAAAAVVAARAEPLGGRRRRPQSVWELLPKVEPALREWAAFFAAGAAKRAAAEAGLPRAVSADEADDLLRDAETFISLAEGALGILGHQELLPLPTAG